jgi:hypothetical protein
MPNDLELNANSILFRATLAIQARAIREERALLHDSEEERARDWRTALHRLGRTIAANSIQEIVRCDLRRVTMTEDYPIYLSDVIIEDCKELLAWQDWKSKGAVVDSDTGRIARDWQKADESIKEALFRLEPSEVADSVRDYLNRCYRDESRSLLSRRAYWHYRAHPASGWDANQRAAERYIYEFYSLASKVIDQGSASTIGQLRTLILSNSEVASCLELLYVGLRRIDRSIEVGGWTGSKESVEPLSALS